jgi:hypothetical protein
MPTSLTWDVFVAHAGPDKPTAEALYDLLSPHMRVFVDSKCLDLGDDWDQALRQAQQQALISVVLVSSRTDNAYYEREEIAAAVALARSQGSLHRVIPVYLDTAAKDQASVPYGLRLKQGLTVGDVGGVPGVAQQLLQAYQRLKQKINDAAAGGSIAPPAPPVAGADAVIPPMPPPPVSPMRPVAPTFVAQCIFNGDPAQYFVTATDEIIGIVPGRPAIVVGRKIPPTVMGFAWMYATPVVIYGVDPQGGIWNRTLTGMPFQVGQAFALPLQ